MSAPLRQMTLAFGAPKPKANEPQSAAAQSAAAPQSVVAPQSAAPHTAALQPKAAAPEQRSPENHSPQEEDERKPAAAASTGREPSSSHTPATKKASPAAKKPKTAASPGPSQPAGSTKRPSPSASKSPAANKSPATKKPKSEPPPLPSAEPCLTAFPDQAKPAVLVAMQMLRVYAPLLQLRAFSEERLLEDLAASDAVASSASGGVLSELHVALLRVILQGEEHDSTYESPIPESEYMAGAEGEGEEETLMGWPAVAGGKTGAPGLSLDYGPTHFPKVKDAEVLLDTLTWPELLRQLVVHWAERPVAPKWQTRGPQLADDDLTALAVALRDKEYAELPLGLRALALQALCERTLYTVQSEIEAADAELLSGKQQALRNEKELKKLEKQQAAELKKACSEAWKALEEMEAAAKAAETEASQAVMRVHTEAVKSESTQRHAEMCKAASSKAKAAHEAARRDYQRAKARRDGTAPPPEASDAAPAGTSRQHEKRAAAEAEKAEKARAQELTKLREMEVRRKHLAELRGGFKNRLLGEDRNGARYWLLPKESTREDDGGEESVLYVETKAGSWGEMGDVEALKQALRASTVTADIKLRVSLSGAPPIARSAAALKAASSAGNVAAAPPGQGSAPLDREPDSSDDEDETQIVAAQAAAKRAKEQAKLDAQGVRRRGHEWLGRRVRLLGDERKPVDGTITGWRPASVVEPAPQPDAPDEGATPGEAAVEMAAVTASQESESSEVREVDSVAGDGPSPGAPSDVEERWLVELDDGKTAMLDAAEVEEALAEARDAPLRRLKKLLLHAQAGARDDLTLWTKVAPPASKAGSSDDKWLDSGHTWLGRTVLRLGVDAVITRWQPADGEDGVLFHVVHADGDEEDIDEDEARDAMAGSADSGAGGDDDSADKVAHAEHRSAWVARVHAAEDAAGLRLALQELSEVSKTAHDATGAGASWWSTWRKHLNDSATIAQLAVRLIELEAAIATCGDLRVGTEVEVAVAEKDGKEEEWLRAPIVSVWRDGSFRVLVQIRKSKEAGEWIEDFASPASKTGRKEYNKDWRTIPKPRSKRGAADSASASEQPRGPRAAAKKARSASSFVDKSIYGMADSDEESPARGRDSFDFNSLPVSKAPEMGETIELKEKRKKGGPPQWRAAEVVRIFRGGAFEAQHVDAPSSKGKYKEEDEMITWRRAS